MNTINLQSKTQAERGTVEKYWFENENIGLKRTLFHRVYIPLKPFNSGLDHDAQPVETEIVIEWLNLQLPDPDDLDNLDLSKIKDDQTEVSLYLGGAHNPCEILKMNWAKTADHSYLVSCELLIDLEYEGVAKNESFRFETILELDPRVKE
ncbi:MAG: hypothetical protein ACPF9D_07875 [Owenweeksia sp.]